MILNIRHIFAGDLRDVDQARLSVRQLDKGSEAGYPGDFTLDYTTNLNKHTEKNPP
jgi:hypothetical protein